MKRPSLQDEVNAVDDWNRDHAIGTAVKYWRGALEDGPGKTGKTTSAAKLLSGHTAVVWIEGCSGCIALSHVVVEIDAEFAK